MIASFSTNQIYNLLSSSKQNDEARLQQGIISMSNKKYEGGFLKM